MLNKVIIMGRLTRDPEFRQTTSGIPVCRITVAVDRPYQKDKEKQADFINCTVWRSSAEFVSRYFSKGSMIIVEGALRNNDYTDKDGVKHYSMDVLAQNVSFGESKSAREGQAPIQQQNNSPQYGSVPATNNNPYAQQPLKVDDLGEFEEILSDGSIPF